MDIEAIARHLGVDSGQIVSARPEDDGYRVLVDYGIGGIKVLHVEVPKEPEVPEEPRGRPAEASSPKAEEPAVVVVSDKPATKKSVPAPKVVKAQRK